MIDERIRGSSDIPLNKKGIAHARDLGKATAGQIDNIHTSSLSRSIHTAAAIKASNPDASVSITKDLHPWRMGADEGKPVSEVLPKMLHRIEKHPDEPSSPGRGPQSTEDGESFNEFKNRSLGYLRNTLEQHEPGTKDVLVGHYRNMHVAHAWLKGGAKPDLSVDTKSMLEKHPSKPGDLWYVNPKSKQLEKVDDAKRPGVYLARHGETDWNENGQNSSTSF